MVHSAVGRTDKKNIGSRRTTFNRIAPPAWLVKNRLEDKLHRARDAVLLSGMAAANTGAFIICSGIPPALMLTSSRAKKVR
jgi:hypothetical protein